MTTHHDYDVICAGLIVADHVCAPIDRLPAAGALVCTNRLDLSIGGCGANTAVNLARLGVDVGLAGRIGHDPMGAFVRDVLTQQGVACELLGVSHTSQTSATLVVNVAGEDRRFIHAVGANAEFTGDETPLDVVARAGMICVGGYGLNPALGPDQVLRLFQAAQRAGGQALLDVVIDDPARVRRMLEPVLPSTDVFLPNFDEGRQLTGESDPVEQIREFRRLGARTVVITGGPRGVWAANEKGLFHMPAYHVEQVDGTGGGDAFTAGFVFGLLQNADLHNCLAYGSAMGARCVQSVGATTGGFRREELLAFVAAHPLDLVRL